MNITKENAWNSLIKRVKIAVMIPRENTDEIRVAACDAGAGVIGEYTYCSTSIESIGTFKPGQNANPYIGENGQLEFVHENKLEMVCNIENVRAVVDAIRKIHPYEEPAIDIIPLIDESIFR